MRASLKYHLLSIWWILTPGCSHHMEVTHTKVGAETKAVWMCVACERIRVERT